MNKLDKHVFSFHLENLSDLVSNLNTNQTLEFADKTLHHRLIDVLRLKESENFVLFDDNINVEFSIQPQTFENKKKIFASILKINPNKPLSPEIIFCPSLLKKSYFQDACYIAAQMGINIIQPVLTQKVQRQWGGQKEKERLHKIMISASEQSKNFVIPELMKPVNLQNLLKSLQNDTKKVFFLMLMANHY